LDSEFPGFGCPRVVFLFTEFSLRNKYLVLFKFRI
jgi:hypothetical protein